MKINVISGFLGSGKTTFVCRAVASLIREKQEKVAVLVNEFGEIGIDGEIIGRENVDVTELPQGCICCSLKAGLKDAILEIANRYQPQRLIIEPTGIALPSQIVETMQDLILQHVVEGVEKVVKDLNPEARIYLATYAGLPIQQVFVPQAMEVKVKHQPQVSVRPGKVM